MGFHLGDEPGLVEIYSGFSIFPVVTASIEEVGFHLQLSVTGAASKGWNAGLKAVVSKLHRCEQNVILEQSDVNKYRRTKVSSAPV